MMEQDVPFETVTKIEVAERQLCVAIQLFFERRDPIAVHTLATAAQDVLRQLAEPRKIKGLYECVDDVVRPEKKKELIDHFRKSQNFFKHAGKDPNEKLDFYSGATKFYLFDAVRLLGLLTGRYVRETATMFGWFLAKHPYLFNVDDFPDLKKFKDLVTTINPDDFEVVLLAMKNLKMPN